MIDYRDGRYLIDGAAVENCIHGCTSLHNIFSPDQGPAYNANRASFTRLMPIRAFVYENIKNDFQKVTAEYLLLELDFLKNNAYLANP